MGKHKRVPERINSLEWRISQHEQKIAIEKERFNPDVGLIDHWEKEIKGWQDQIERKRELPPGRK
jgi:hypothetical protein